MRTVREEGFVLIATLWFVALLGLAAVLVEGWVSTSLERGAALGVRVAARAAMFSAVQRVAFDLASGTASPRGVELISPGGQGASKAGGDAGSSVRPFVALDDRPYRIGDIMVRLQDGAGLLDINGADHDTLDGFLKGFGTAAAARDALADALIDYRSKRRDDRGPGVRNFADGTARSPVARHAPLLTPWELLRVAGWETRPELWRPAASIINYVTLGPVGAMNVNTAPAWLLSALGGIDKAVAARLVLARAARPLTPLDQATMPELRTGDETHRPSFLPANILRLQLAAPDEARIRVLQIRIAPTGPMPLRIDFAVDLPRAAAGWSSDVPPAAAWPSRPSAPGTP